MFVLGLLLMIIAGAAAVGFLVSNYGGDAFSISLFGQNIDNVHRATLYIAGIATAVVFLLGLRLITAGIARSRRRRLERKRLAAESRGTAKELKAENERLAKRLEEEKRGRESAQDSAYPTETAPGGAASAHGKHGDHGSTEHAGSGDSAEAEGSESEGRRGLFRR